MVPSSHLCPSSNLPLSADVGVRTAFISDTFVGVNKSPWSRHFKGHLSTEAEESERQTADQVTGSSSPPLRPRHPGEQGLLGVSPLRSTINPQGETLHSPPLGPLLSHP